MIGEKEEMKSPSEIDNFQNSVGKSSRLSTAKSNTLSRNESELITSGL